MERFDGFPEGKIQTIPLPSLFFEQLLPRIDNLAELKVILHFFWRLHQQEGVFRYLKYSEMAADRDLLVSLENGEEPAALLIQNALQSAVRRGALLEVKMDIQGGECPVYFLNSAKGRAAVRAIESGQWTPGEDKTLPAGMPVEPVNIFRLYEENIGAITPLLAESLKDAEELYPGQWIEDAIRIAVKNNKRSWRYIEAILKRWQQEGRNGKKDESQNRRDTAEDRRSYIDGEYSDFIEH